MNSNIYVLYHANCLDGFGAAYAAWRELGDSAHYIPAQYDKPVPAELLTITNKEIYLLDFSYPTDILEQIGKENYLTVIDHHEGALPALEAVSLDKTYNYTYYYDAEKSGAVATWDYFLPAEPVPMMLRHIQDRDLWQFKLEGTKEIAAALACTAIFPRTFEAWQYVIDAAEEIDGETYYTFPYAVGKTLLAKYAEQVAAFVEQAYMLELLPGLRVLAVCAPYEYASDVGNRLAENQHNPSGIGLVWQYLSGKQAKCSIRSVNGSGVDCIAVAQSFGGGGHKHASGFNCNIERVL
jgi:uncharacterized protein